MRYSFPMFGLAGIILACGAPLPEEDRRGSGSDDDTADGSDTPGQDTSADTGGGSETGGSETGGDGDTEDSTPPVIVHTPIDRVIPFGDDVTIEAGVTDEESRVLLVTLWFKDETGGSSDWNQRAMAADERSVYRTVLPGSTHRSAGVHYYIEATNAASLRGTHPAEGADDPHRFRISTR